jgi:ABC-type oligopeptide transport system substrate-binding subunit
MDYVKRFENIVYEDSAVIPLFHMKQTWLYSADLDVSQVTSTADVPLFEHLRLKR